MLLADTPPVNLLIIEERAVLYRTGKEEPKELRTETIEQEKWENLKEKAAWTKELTRDIRLSLNRKHDKTNYNLTQMLTDCAGFQAYVHEFGRAYIYRM